MISRIDPTYQATEKHFADLFTRYSSPICVLNLVKQREKRPRESVVGQDFSRAVEYINGTLPWEHKVGGWVGGCVGGLGRGEAGGSNALLDAMNRVEEEEGEWVGGGATLQ